jgi:hypothetical protein
VYDKLGVADRLELALYCLHHRVVENTDKPVAQAAAAAAGAGQGSKTDVPTAPVSSPETIS